MSALTVGLFVSAGLSIVLILLAQAFRGGLRLSCMLLGVVGLTPSAIGIAVIAIGGHTTTSNVLTVVGVLASFIFGFAGERLNITQGRSVRLGLVISSKDAFHQEVRHGLYEELRGSRVTITDLGGSPDAPREDLANFSELLRRTVRERVDYLVMWPPGADAAEGDEVDEAVRRLRRQGGLSIFLENSPAESPSQMGYAVVRHDAVSGATLLAEAVRNVLDRNLGSLMLVLGPQFSSPGKIRGEVLTGALSATPDVECLQLASWSVRDAVGRIANRVKAGARPNVIVCPNDAIALALVDDIAEWRHLAPLRRTKILGFDGMRRAVACIAERGTNFEATVVIPPSEYGRIAGRLVRTLGRPGVRPGRALRAAAKEYRISFDARKIVDPARARRRLYDENE